MKSIFYNKYIILILFFTIFFSSCMVSHELQRNINRRYESKFVIGKVIENKEDTITVKILQVYLPYIKVKTYNENKYVISNRKHELVFLINDNDFFSGLPLDCSQCQNMFNISEFVIDEFSKQIMSNSSLKRIKGLQKDNFIIIQYYIENDQYKISGAYKYNNQNSNFISKKLFSCNRFKIIL